MKTTMPEPVLENYSIAGERFDLFTESQLKAAMVAAYNEGKQAALAEQSEPEGWLCCVPGQEAIFLQDEPPDTRYPPKYKTPLFTHPSKPDDFFKTLPHGRQMEIAPSKPDDDLTPGWVRAADEEMICAHIGVANLSDSYETAKRKLNTLIDWHVAVATDPEVNGGLSLQQSKPAPLPELTEEDIIKLANYHTTYQIEAPSNSGMIEFARAILAAREKAK